MAVISWDLSHLTEGTIVIIMWTLTGVAIILSMIRFLTRYLSPPSMVRLYWDDIMHLLGLLTLVAFSTCYYIQTLIKNRILGGQSDLPTPLPTIHEYHGIDQDTALLARLDIVNAVLLWSCFWLIKFSFMIYYRILFNPRDSFRKAWPWLCGVIAFLFFLPLVGVAVGCDSWLNSDDTILCNPHLPTYWGPDKPPCPVTLQKTLRQILISSCFVNCSTDLAILLLALYNLATLQLRLKSKLILGAPIFIMVAIIIALDIARTVTTISQGSVICAIIEINLVVIIGCAPMLPLLFRVKRCPSVIYKFRISGTSSRRGSERTLIPSDSPRTPKGVYKTWITPSSATDTSSTMDDKVYYDVESADLCRANTASCTTPYQPSPLTTITKLNEPAGNNDSDGATEVQHAENVQFTVPTTGITKTDVNSSRPSSWVQASPTAPPPTASLHRPGTLYRDFKFPAEQGIFREACGGKISCHEMNTPVTIGVAL